MLLFSSIATGLDPLRMILNCRADPQSLLLFGEGYELRKQVVVTYLRAYGNSTLSSARVKILEQLKRRLRKEGITMDFKIYFDERTKLVRTKDADTMLGKVILSGDNLQKLTWYSKLFRSAERKRYFEISL